MWLIPIFFTLHNVEEALAFARMRPHIAAVVPVWLRPLEAQLSSGELQQALAAVSVLTFMLAGFVILRPDVQFALWLLLALEAAVAINALAHLASALVFFHGYGPGLATAVLVNAPFAVYVLGRVKRERWVSERAWRLLAAGGLVLHGPVLLGVLWLVALRLH